MLTSLADVQIRQTCLNAGASFFLDKSFDMDKLPAVFKAVADKLRNC